MKTTIAALTLRTAAVFLACFKAGAHYPTPLARSFDGPETKTKQRRINDGEGRAQEHKLFATYVGFYER